MAVAARNPKLSVFELVELFDDKPTCALVVAICEQTEPQTARRLLTVMYQVPETGKLPDDFLYRLSAEQEQLLDEGLAAWFELRQRRRRDAGQFGAQS